MAASVSSSASIAPAPSRIARSAMLVMGLLALSKVIGLTQKVLIIQRFGVTADWDTFTVANQLPEQLFNLIAGGALAYAFIPVFGSLLTRNNRDGAWRLASNVMNTIFLITLVIAAIVFLAAPWLVANVIADYKATSSSLALPWANPTLIAVYNAGSLAHVTLLINQTAALMRILLVGLLIFSLSGLSIGILQAQQHFFLPALAPILYDLGILFGVVFLKRFGVYGIAVGAVLGAALHFAIQIPGLIKFGFKWRPIINWRDVELREVIVLMIPRAIGLGLANINLLVAYRFASGLGTGSAASFNWGYAFMQLPQTLIGTAMGIVIFPTLAVLSAAGDLRGKRSAASGALRFILIATIPAAVAMILAGRPLMGLLEGGTFQAEDADRVFQVVQFFALSLITQSVVEIVARAFYADKDMVTPLWIALIAAIVNVVLSLLFIPALNVAGLALANGLAVGTEMVLLIIILRRRWQGLEDSNLISTTVKALLSAAAMGLVMVILEVVLQHTGSSKVGLFIRAALEIGAGGIVYLAVALLLKMDDLRDLPRLILRRQMIEAPAEA